jgi:tetratricopeptide (TPR) repeat protein
LSLTLYFTSSRGAWLSTVLGVGVTIILYSIRRTNGWNQLSKKVSIVKSNPKPYLIFATIFVVLSIAVFIVFYNQATQTRHGPLFQSRQRIWENAFNVFMISPIWGNGPGSVRPLYAEIAQIPPGFSAGHAHNLFLQIGGEMGIIGILIAIAILLSTSISFLQSWKAASADQRVWLAGSAGALSSLFLHNQFDYLFEPLPNVLGLLILILCVQRFTDNRVRIVIHAKYFAITLLLLFGPMIFYHALLSKPMHSFSEAVTEGQKGNWSKTRSSICSLSDETWALSHYTFQCGYAAAEEQYMGGGEENLNHVILKIKNALLTDHYWPMHRALLASLQWKAGQNQTAISQMQSALKSAPNNADLALNLGWMHETSGNFNEAAEYYQTALNLDPWLQRSVFFNQTDVRRSIHSKKLVDWSPGSPSSELWLGWEALELESYHAAEMHFNQVLNQSAFNVYAYSGLAYAFAEQGNVSEARYYLESAKLLENHRPFSLYTLALTARTLGDSEEAELFMNQAFRLSRWKSQSSEHLASTYRRPVLPSDRTPYMVHADFSPKMIRDFVDYAASLKNNGEHEYANEILRWIESESDHTILSEAIE